MSRENAKFEYTYAYTSYIQKKNASGGSCSGSGAPPRGARGPPRSPAGALWGPFGDRYEPQPHGVHVSGQRAMPGEQCQVGVTAFYLSFLTWGAQYATTTSLETYMGYGPPKKGHLYGLWPSKKRSFLWALTFQKKRSFVWRVINPLARNHDCGQVYCSRNPERPFYWTRASYDIYIRGIYHFFGLKLVVLNGRQGSLLTPKIVGNFHCPCVAIRFIVSLYGAWDRSFGISTFNFLQNQF